MSEREVLRGKGCFLNILKQEAKDGAVRHKTKRAHIAPFLFAYGFLRGVRSVAFIDLPVFVAVKTSKMFRNHSVVLGLCYFSITVAVCPHVPYATVVGVNAAVFVGVEVVKAFKSFAGKFLVCNAAVPIAVKPVQKRAPVAVKAPPLSRVFIVMLFRHMLAAMFDVPIVTLFVVCFGVFAVGWFREGMSRQCEKT